MELKLRFLDGREVADSRASRVRANRFHRPEARFVRPRKPAGAFHYAALIGYPTSSLPKKFEWELPVFAAPARFAATHAT